MNARWIVALLVTAAWLGTAAAADSTPTAFRASVMPLSRVDSITLPAIDRSAVDAEDAANESRGAPPRFAVPRKTSITPDKNGTWETVDSSTRLWRYVVKTPDASSLNLGFTRFALPPGASLLLYSPDGKRIRGPFTSAYNRSYKQLWTPVILSPEIVVELTIPTAAVAALELEIGQIGQGYRGFDVGDKASSGSCNMDVACVLSADPWQENVRAVAMISLNGTQECSGSLINDAAGDTKMYFMTAHHCGINAGNASTLVTYWNYENSTCRVPGSSASGSSGNGSLDQFNTGATLRADYAASDFTLVEMSDPADPTFNLFWAGWDHTPYVSPGGPGAGDFACSADSLCAAIHHPNVADKRITFSAQNTVSSGYGGNAVPPVPGDLTHIWVHWNPNPVFPPDPSISIPPQVTEGGSSGSPLYNAQRRYIGQLHGGPSSCGQTKDNLSDVYGHVSVSWEGGGTSATRLKDWLDPQNTGAMFIDGRNQCTAPPVPGNIVATANGKNQIDVTWDAAAGADSYKVYRGDGACPGTNWQLVADNLTTTSYTDSNVSGNATYAYAVTSFSSSQTCESAHSDCSAATATGSCTLAPTFGGLISASSSANATCGVDLGWAAGTNNCGGGALKYNIFRSTTAGFTPDASNRIANCQTGTSYHDAAVDNGTHYYYTARAEDDTTNGSGSCNSGNEDTNTIEQAATPAGPPGPVGSDDMESGGANWTVAGSGAGANFSIVTDQSHSPTHAFFAPDGDDVGDHTLTTANPLNFAAGDSFDFWHHFATESDGSNLYDGVVLEYSLDGTTWTDILAANGVIPANANRFTSGGYSGTISTCCNNPLGGRQAWSGDSGGFVHVVVDPTDFIGHVVSFRWRIASDESFGAGGYWLDDAPAAVGTMCSAGSNDLIFKDGFDGT